MLTNSYWQFIKQKMEFQAKPKEKFLMIEEINHAIKFTKK